MVNYKQHLLTLSQWIIIVLIVWLWARFALRDNTIDTGGVSIKTSSSSHITNNDSIERYHIFGSAQQLYEIPLASSNTTLKFTLNGTMSNEDASTGIAYITNAQGVQEKYHVGDKIFSVATLKEIYKTHVIINHNGKNEKLALTENDSSVTTTAQKKSNTKKPPSFLKHLNGNQQRNWQETLDQQKFDPNKISSIVGNINLVTNQSGQVQGLRVSNLAASNMLAKQGLKSNDVITAINGNRVSSKNMLSIQETLKKNPNATVTIKRNGKIQNVKINLSNL